MSKIQKLLKADPKDFMKVLRETDSKGEAKSIIPAASTPFTPSLPRINILPSSVEEILQARALTKKFIIAGATVAVLLAAVYGGGIVLGMSHTANIEAKDLEAAEIQKQIQSSQPFQAYQTEVADKRTALSSQLQSDVNMSEILNRLNNTAEGTGIDLDSIAISLSEASNSIDTLSATTCSSPDPFGSEPTIGCVSLMGSGASKDNVTNFFTSLDGLDGFAFSFISNVTNGTDDTGSTTTFTGTVSMTDVFYSGKYVDLTLPLDQIISGTPTETAPTDSETTETPAAEADDEALTPAQLTSLNTSLQDSFKDVFTDATEDATVQTLATGLCKAIADGDEATAYATIIQTATGITTVAPDQVTGITSLIAGAACPANQQSIKQGA